MRIPTALLVVAVVVVLGVCSAQKEVVPLGTVSGEAAQVASEVTPQKKLVAMPSGTTAKDVLSSITLRPAPTKQAVVVPIPPRYAAQATASMASQPVPAGAFEADKTAAAAAAPATPPESNLTAPAALPSNASSEGPAHQPASAAATASAADASLMDAPSNVYQGILDRHNYYRSWHAASSLTWSAQLAADAQNWASQCMWGHADTGGSQGENLLMYPDASNPTAWLIKAADEWYAEVGKYPFYAPGFYIETGHFTQLVWRSTTQLGCAVAACPGFTYVVCRYSAPGNVEGQYEDNVLPRQANPLVNPPTPPAPQPPANTPQPPTPPSQTPNKPPEGVIPEGYYMSSHNCLIAPSKNHWLCLNHDGRLVLYNQYGQATWASTPTRTSTNAPMMLVMQTNGNLEVIDKAGMVVWASNTVGQGVASRRFQVQDDGNALIADSRRQFTWATNTRGQ